MATDFQSPVAMIKTRKPDPIVIDSFLANTVVQLVIQLKEARLTQNIALLSGPLDKNRIARVLKNPYCSIFKLG